MHRVVVFALSVILCVVTPAASSVAAPLSFPGVAEIPANRLPYADLEVTMKPKASAAQVAAVRRRITGSRDVIRYAQVTGRERYDAFIDKSDGSVDDVFEPGDFGDQFGVDLFSRGVYEPTKLRNQLRRMPGVGLVADNYLQDEFVDDIGAEIDACADVDHNVVVFLQVDPWQIQRAAIEGVLRTDPRMTLVRTVEPEDALAEFRQRYPDSYPDVTPEHLPVSFEISVSPGTDDYLLDELRALAGVDAAMSSDSGCDVLARHDVGSR